MKRIIIDMERRTEHHMLSGRTFPVDQRLERAGAVIYLDRTYLGHPTIAACRSFLLPKQHLWVMFWQGHSEPHRIECYTHMARILDETTRVIVEDLYLDMVLWRESGRWELVDVDEFREAVEAGELSPAQMHAALLGLENGARLMAVSPDKLEAFLRTEWLKEESEP